MSHYFWTCSGYFKRVFFYNFSIPNFFCELYRKIYVYFLKSLIIAPETQGKYPRLWPNKLLEKISYCLFVEKG